MYATRTNDSETIRDTTRKPQRDGLVRLIGETGRCNGKQKPNGKSVREFATRKRSPIDDDASDVFLAVDKKRLEKKKFDKEMWRLTSQ